MGKLTGENNVFVGRDAGICFDDVGEHNILIGAAAGRSLKRGSRNIIIGSYDVPAEEISDYINIGGIELKSLSPEISLALAEALRNVCLKTLESAA